MPNIINFNVNAFNSELFTAANSCMLSYTLGFYDHRNNDYTYRFIQIPFVISKEGTTIADYDFAFAWVDASTSGNSRRGLVPVYKRKNNTGDGTYSSTMSAPRVSGQWVDGASYKPDGTKVYDISIASEKAVSGGDWAALIHPNSFAFVPVTDFSGGEATSSDYNSGNFKFVTVKGIISDSQGTIVPINTFLSSSDVVKIWSGATPAETYPTYDFPTNFPTPQEMYYLTADGYTNYDGPIPPTPTDIPIIFNGNTVENIVFNGTAVEHLVFNGTSLY